MTSESCEAEVKSYVRQTVLMHLPAGDHLTSFLDFALRVLTLVRDSWPAESAAWLHALEARRQGSLSMGQWRDVQSHISTYRVGIGEPYGMNEAHGEKAAISFLFALAIESPGVAIHEYRFPQFGRLLDDFSCEFIEQFGHSQEVVENLKCAFHITIA